jgi:hypothetical protein
MIVIVVCMVDLYKGDVHFQDLIYQIQDHILPLVDHVQDVVIQDPPIEIHSKKYLQL